MLNNLFSTGLHEHFDGWPHSAPGVHCWEVYRWWKRDFGSSQEQATGTNAQGRKGHCVIEAKKSTNVEQHQHSRYGY